MKHRLIKATLIALAIFSLHITNSVFAAAGDLDLTFSSDGIALNQFGDGDDAIADIAILADGAIIAAGTSGLNSNSQIVLAKYKSDGSLDLSFGTNGKVTTRNIRNLAAESVAIQSDGKILVGGNVRPNGSNGSFVVIRYNPDGSLDSTFGNAGIVRTAISNVNLDGGFIAIQPDGNIILAGNTITTNPDSGRLVLVQYKPDGSLATDFGNSGILISTNSVFNRAASSVVIQSNGRIVVAGTAKSTLSNDDFAVARFLSNGTLDTSFDADGIVTTSFGTENDQAKDVAIQSNGDIVVTGNATIAGNVNFAVVRYKTNGSLDSTFDSDGIVLLDAASSVVADTSLTIQSNGRIVVAGTTADFFVFRLNTNGSLDTTFDTDGIVTTDVSTRSDNPSSIIIQADGKIVAAGSSGKQSSALVSIPADFALVRYNSNGSIDNIDTDGIITTGDFSSNADLKAVALQSNGKIVAAGSSFNGVSRLFTVVRYNTNGSLDTTFDADGIVTTPITSTRTIELSVAIQADGKIIVAGEAAGSLFELYVVRYNTNGSLDTSFDTDGIVIIDNGSKANPDSAAVAIQSNGKILVAGSTSAGVNFRSFMLARLNTNGSLDTTFDTDGIAVTSINTISTESDLAESLAIQSDGKIVVVGSSSLTSTNTVFAVVRYNINGGLDTTFNSDGIVTTAFVTPPATNRSVANSVAIDANGKIVVGGSALSQFALVRYNSNGSLDTSFDTDGKVTTNVSSASDSCNSIKIQSDGKILAGGTASNDFALVRYNTNGSLDTTSFAENTSNLFGSGGIVTTDLNELSNDTIEAIAIQADGKIIAVGTSDEQFAVARYQALAPTAATAAINGRVSTASGRSIRNVSLTLTDTTTGEIKYTLTNPFGYYRFQDLEVGRSYILNLGSKRFTFAEPTRVISLNEDLTGEDFVSEEK
jgi:uncharacterized delta-60 repeat protein